MKSAAWLVSRHMEWQPRHDSKLGHGDASALDLCHELISEFNGTNPNFGWLLWRDATASWYSDGYCMTADAIPHLLFRYLRRDEITPLAPDCPCWRCRCELRRSKRHKTHVWRDLFLGCILCRTPLIWTTGWHPPRHSGRRDGSSLNSIRCARH